MAQEWQSYDSAADVHDRVATPAIFEPPARDLVAALGPSIVGTILDVGAGTGIAARMAIESSPGAVVVALDPSLKMLRAARCRSLDYVVVGAVPGLPFCADTFDRVLASFVLSHVADYKAALGDMVRALRPAGKLGATTWSGIENEYRQFWQSMADALMGKEKLEAAVAQALPWEDWFMNSAHLRGALEEAGLTGIELRETHYTTQMSIADFLEMRETSLQARYMRGVLDLQQWEQFKREVSAAFYKRFSDPIEHTGDVHIATGVKPAFVQTR
jgi:ubiquinone/menaquinone biosynthesis C-methylase UbiE